MSAARPGSIVAAIWLIGLGIVFLVQRAVNLPWSEAWPMFAILVGVANLVSRAVTSRSGFRGLWDYTWPVAWIVVGSLLLASTTGSISEGPGELIANWWPWAVIILGAWFVVGAVAPGGPATAETLAVPVAGRADARMRIQFGAGTLTTHTAARGLLIDGSFNGGVVMREDAPGHITLSQDVRFGWPGLDRASEWTLGLSAEIPLDLRVDVGAARTSLDLADLLVRRLELHTGASETRVRLPRAAGVTDVRIEAGAASVTLEIPTGVAARIRSRMVLGATQVDETRFPRIGDVYQSADYGTAPNRVDIDAQGGVGSVRITTVA